MRFLHYFLQSRWHIVRQMRRVIVIFWDPVEPLQQYPPFILRYNTFVKKIQKDAKIPY